MAVKIARVQTADRLTNQLQQNIVSVIEPIFQNLVGQFVATLTGCTTSPQGIVTWQRPTAGGPVTVKFPFIAGISNTTSAFLTGLPSNLWPTSIQICIAAIQDNGTTTVSGMIFNTDGTIQLLSNISSAVFTASGTKGIISTTVTYATAI